MKEEDLYPDIKKWLTSYLKDRYKRYQIETTSQTSKRSLDIVLKEKGIVVKDAIGLSIKVDIVGILRKRDDVKLVFIEVKNKPLTLKDLGQLWGYTQLVNPLESFLISPKGLGALECLLKVLKREDLLYYGPKREKMMKVAKWDERRKAIDYDSLIPKL